MSPMLPLAILSLSGSWGQLDLPAETPSLIEAYRAWDASHNGGRGRSDGRTSGAFAWGEATFLRDYMMCHAVSRDPYWLAKVVDHFDRMVGVLSAPDGDGFLAWRDVAYSVGVVTVHPDGAEQGFTVSPAESRVWRGRGGELVTGHTYRLEFAKAEALRVLDTTEGAVLAELPYRDGLVVDQIPGAKLTLEGEPRAGEGATVEARAPEECEYQVHDGMVTYPIALFIETVWRDPELHGQFKAKADEYARLIHDHFLLKWEATWNDVGEEGLYRFSGNPTQRFPGYSLPHNQYLALARTWLVLQAQPEAEDRELYRERATRMARYFKRHLRLQDGAYVWNYWDPLPGEDGVSVNVEDYSHATIDISFAVEAQRRGTVFDEEDMRRFARTWVDVMWNGDSGKPLFGARVGDKAGDKLAWWEWVQLGQFDERAYDLAVSVFLAQGKAPPMAPSLAYMAQEAAGEH